MSEETVVPAEVGGLGSLSSPGEGKAGAKLLEGNGRVRMVWAAGAVETRLVCLLPGGGGW